MKKKGKRAQITIFIVLGIVILLIFGFVFYVSKQSSGKVLEKKIDRIYGDFLRVTSLENYIQTCLEQATKDAIILAGLQGGKIFDTQAEGGFALSNADDTIPAVIVDGTTIISAYKVSYGIKSVSDISQYPDNKPLDPSPSETFNNPAYDSLFAKKETNLLNLYSLTALCNLEGPNYYGIRNASYSCETLSAENESFQQYLRIYVLNRTKACVNLLQFSGQTQLSIKEGEVDGFVAMGDDDVFVSLRYPLLLSLKNSPPFTRFLEFSFRPKIRLKKLHEWASHAIGYYGPTGMPPRADAHNIFFNMTQELPLDGSGISPDDPQDCTSNLGEQNQPCKLPGFAASRLYSPLSDFCRASEASGGISCCTPSSSGPGCINFGQKGYHSDIVNFSDTSTLLDGRPLAILFAVENRAPVLGLIGDNKTSPGQKFTLQFTGRDPDDVNVLYELKGPNCAAPDNTLQPRIVNGEAAYEPNGDIIYQSQDGGIAVDHEFCMVIKDEEGLSDQQRFWVRIGSP